MQPGRPGAQRHQPLVHDCSRLVVGSQLEVAPQVVAGGRVALELLEYETAVAQFQPRTFARRSEPAVNLVRRPNLLLELSGLVETELWEYAGQVPETQAWYGR